MARIPTADSLQDSQVSTARNVVPISGAALAAPGQAVQKLAAAGVNAGTLMAESGQKDQDYAAHSKFLQFDIDQERALDEAKRAAPEDGSGFADSVKQGYDAAAQDFFKNVPPGLKPKYNSLLIARGGQYQKEARHFENQRQDDFATQDVSTKLTDLGNLTLDNPDRSQVNTARGVSLIDASRLPPAAKLRLKRKFSEDSQEYAVRGRIARGDDPESIITDLTGKRPEAPLDDAEVSSATPSAKSAPISFQLETGQTDPLKGVANISRDSGGTHSYGNFGLNSQAGGDAQRFADEYGNALGLKGKPGTPEFDASWKASAAADPEGLHQAEMDWHSKNITPRVTTDLTKAGISDEVAADPRVQAYFADRLVQYGPASIDKHKSRIWDAFEQSGGDVEKFLHDMTESDRGKMQQDFPRALRSGVYGAEGHDTRLDGRLNLSLQAAGDAPGEEKYTGPYSRLSASKRLTLLNVVKTAGRETSLQDIRDSEEQIRNTGVAPTDAKGRTALDRAKISLTRNELSKADLGWQQAQQEYKAVSPLPNMTSTEAHDHLDQLTPNHLLEGEHYAIASKVQDKAEKAWDKIEKLRKSDPAKAVESAPEMAQAQSIIKASRNLSPVQQSEIVIEARKKAQTRIGIPDYQQRVISEAEAAELLQIPQNPDSPDEVETAVKAAADRAKEAYGKYAGDALNSAISLHIKGKQNREVARDLAAGLQGAPTRAAATERSWTDMLTGMFSSKPSGPVPNQQQFDWVAADPGSRSAIFDQKFGAGAAAKALAENAAANSKQQKGGQK